MNSNNAKLIREQINFFESHIKKVLSENNKTSLVEANPLGRYLSGELGGVKVVAQDLLPITKKIIKDPRFKRELLRIGVKTENELFNLIKNDFKHAGADIKTTKLPMLNPNIAGELRGAVELEILKSSKTNKQLLDLTAENLVKNAKFREKYKAYGNETDFINALKKNGFSDQGAKSIAKKRTEFFGGKLKTTSQKMKKSPTPPPTTPASKGMFEKLKGKFNEIKAGLTTGKWNWKRLVMWAAGIGVGASVLWYFINDNSDLPTPEGMPNTPPTVGEWDTCVQDLINNKKGVIVTTPSGQIYVHVKNTGNSEYDTAGGLKFYLNGRVFTHNNSKRGYWKCSGGKAQLEEQFDAEISADVSKMINYLDFPVVENDLINAYNLLKKYTTNGKGIEFLNTYKSSGVPGGGSLETSLRFIVTTKPTSVQTKKAIIGLINQIKSGTSSQTSTTSPSTGGALDNISISWDKPVSSAEGGTGGSTTTPVNQRKYQYCESFPFKFGCKNKKIKEIQVCLGFPKKYQTGNYGPITSAELKKVYNADEIDETLYNKVIQKCKGSTETQPSQTGSTETQPSQPTSTETQPSQPTSTETQPSTGESGGELYARLNSEGFIGSRNKNVIVYKGPDLSKEDRDKLASYMESRGFRLSRENNDYRKGDKIVFKRNK